MLANRETEDMFVAWEGEAEYSNILGHDDLFNQFRLIFQTGGVA